MHERAAEQARPSDNTIVAAALLRLETQCALRGWARAKPYRLHHGGVGASLFEFIGRSTNKLARMMVADLVAPTAYVSRT